MRNKQRGLTLIELMIAGFVLGLLSLVTVALFRTGASGWKKMEAQSTMLADYEVLDGKVTREVQRSTYISASTVVGPDGPTLAFLSAVDDTGVFVLDPVTGEPIWQKFIIFYFDQANRRLYLTDLPLDPASTLRTAPQALEAYPEGTGDLNDYRTGGRLIMTDLDSCTFTLNDSMLAVEVRGSRERFGSNNPETLHMISSMAFHN